MHHTKESAAQTTKPKRPTYHHGDLRSALLDAAEADLEEKGIEGFSLRGVAKRAGVSHAAPAHHFKDTSGLLTALAAIGYEKFLDAQKQRQKKAAPTPGAQHLARGLGYVDFALAHPALFRLIFSSDRTNYENPELAENASRAYENLSQGIRAMRGRDPDTDDEASIDLMASWSLVHGLADLINSGRLNALQQAPKKKRDKMIEQIISRLF